MPNEGILRLFEIEVYFIIALSIIIPVILPEYPLSIIDTLIKVPKKIDAAFLFMIYILFIAPLFDLLIIYLIKKGKILKVSYAMSKNIFILGMVSGMFTYGIILELLVFLEVIDSPFLIYFIALGVLGFFYYKYF